MNAPPAAYAFRNIEGITEQNPIRGRHIRNRRFLPVLCGIALFQPRDGLLFFLIRHQYEMPLKKLRNGYICIRIGSVDTSPS